MMTVNYDREMEKEIFYISKKEIKPKLLLHACCAPCSSACIERLKGVFDITVYYYNPNIDTKEEYVKRAEEEIRFCKEFDINVIVEDFNQQEFYSAVSGFEKEKEGGKRCEICFLLRLNKTAQKAKELSFDYFTTTLTISPLKNAELLNQIGEQCGCKTGVKFLSSDFKKKNGYLRSIELSNQYNLYRQNYCGCVFSKLERESKQDK